MEIVRTKRYLRDMRRLGASASDMAALESAIISNPAVGVVIPGLSGVRKVRFGVGARGKRGGGRAIYFLVIRENVAVMIFAYSKNEQKDLTSEQRKAAMALVKELDDG